MARRIQQRIPVYNSTKRELDGWGAAEKCPTLYAAALAIADQIDDKPGARDLASLTKELRSTVAEIREIARPEVAKRDGVDDLAASRERRRAAAASAS